MERLTAPLDLVPPQDLEAESSVLSAIFVSNGVLVEVQPILDSAAFAVPPWFTSDDDGMTRPSRSTGHAQVSKRRDQMERPAGSGADGVGRGSHVGAPLAHAS